eukprot:2701946-Rhodomonas_salina.1
MFDFFNPENVIPCIVTFARTTNAGNVGLAWSQAMMGRTDPSSGARLRSTESIKLQLPVYSPPAKYTVLPAVAFWSLPCQSSSVGARIVRLDSEGNACSRESKSTKISSCRTGQHICASF